jgi:hypothetical protein
MRQKKVNFWVNESEYERLANYAQSQQLSISEVLRDYIKSLPKVPIHPDRNSPDH